MTPASLSTVSYTHLQPYAFDVSPYAFLECFQPVFDMELPYRPARFSPQNADLSTILKPRTIFRPESDSQHISFQICRRHFRLPGQLVTEKFRQYFVFLQPCSKRRVQF